MFDTLKAEHAEKDGSLAEQGLTLCDIQPKISEVWKPTEPTEPTEAGEEGEEAWQA